MKFSKLLMALCVSVSFVAVAVETSEPEVELVEPVLEMTPQELQEKEKVLIRQMGLPCKPYPKCAD